MTLIILLTSQADPSVTLALTIAPGDSPGSAVVGASANGSNYSFNASDMTSPDDLTLKARGSYLFFSFDLTFTLGPDATAPTFGMDVEGAPMDDGMNLFTLSMADYVAAKTFFANYKVA